MRFFFYLRLLYLLLKKNKYKLFFQSFIYFFLRFKDWIVESKLYKFVCSLLKKIIDRLNKLDYSDIIFMTLIRFLVILGIFLILLYILSPF